MTHQTMCPTCGQPTRGKLITATGASLILGVSSTHVRRLADAGEIPIAYRTESGIRMFEEKEILEAKEKRDRPAKADPVPSRG